MELTAKEQKAREMVCLPLDGLKSLGEIQARVEELSPVVGLFKIGKETFTRFGPPAVKLVQQYRANVFLDLKYHDIPKTVEGAADAATQLGVYMFNVHASGGKAMLEAAVQGAAKSLFHYDKPMPKIVGVTVLTSIDEDILNNQLRVPGTVEEQVLNLAQLCQGAGLDGIVCSAADLGFLKGKLPPDFMKVTPGVEGPRTKAHGSDQKRVATPGYTVQNGSSILVVGRAITDPRTKEQKDAGLVVTPDMRVQAGYEILQDMAPYL